jgi:hypothetical protein
MATGTSPTCLAAVELKPPSQIATSRHLTRSSQKTEGCLSIGEIIAQLDVVHNAVREVVMLLSHREIVVGFFDC